MMSLFGRQRQAQPAAGDMAQEEPLKSHVLPRFIKRIRGAERPTVLDLGRLSGGNIEFFGSIGCRIHIEDLFAGLMEEAAPAREDARSPRQPVAEGAADQPTGDPIPPLRPASRTEPPVRDAAASARKPAGAAIGPLQQGRPGRRPTRHIVLPPRTFQRSGGPDSAGRRTGVLGGGRWKSPLPTRFSFEDGAFDAIVAWDAVDFYDPESARLVAAEMRRILKPGGLVLGFFHAKRATAPVKPRRYRIVAENTFARETTSFEPMQRQVYQNRDIEKLFTGLRIIEQYYLKCGLREILMEKRSSPPEAPRLSRVASRPKPRFRIE